MIGPTSNRAFAEYTTRVAFNLSLTRNMIYWMTVIESGDVNGRTRARRSMTREERAAIGAPNTDSFIPGFRQLETRGLAEHNPRWLTEAANTERMLREENVWVYRLTPAGEHVYALLEIAGLVQTREKPRVRIKAVGAAS